LSEPGGSGPILVWSETLHDYDFGPGHPLTPKRFGPGGELIRAMGVEREMEPEVAGDEAIARVHEPHYIEQVKSFSDHPWQPAAMGVGSNDVPAFHDMHEVSARIVGGSIGGVQRILDGETDHAFSPGGGLHHAMRTRAAGFCVYNDVALAVATARDAGHRVMYIDLDVHHGDGVQTMFWDDPLVLTFSVHESGRSLFPGTGMVEETGGPKAPGLTCNVPLDEGVGDETWWAVVNLTVSVLADMFKPTFIVSQHGCDTHVLDPLAHLRLTTAVYQQAAQLVDRIAHDHAEGRWFATGGGGYDAYRVVPRSWALVWLAQSHRAAPETTPEAWRERWEDPAEASGQAPLPVELVDPPRTAAPDPDVIVSRNLKRARSSLVRSLELQAGC